MSTTKKEIPILDNLRAIAAWSVCLFHFICTTTGFINKDTLTSRIFSYGSYGVHLFFVISGLVIPWSLYHSNYQIKNFFKFFIKRLARLEPPYIISVLIMLAVLFFRKYSPAYDNKEVLVTGKQVLLHFGYLIPFFKGATWLNKVYWTLAIEFQYYVLIGLLYFMFVSKLFYVRFIAYAIIITLPMILSFSNFLPYYLPIFGIGILIFLYKSNCIQVVEFITVSILFSIAIFILNEKIAGIVTVVSELVIILLFNHSNKVLAWLGKFSYSVYLIHAIIGAAVVNILSHYANTTLSKLAVIITGLIVTFCFSYLMYLTVEKPSKKLSSKLAYRKK
ncbi:MAG: acyltransferase family protein [Bacteroidia bacterium]